VEWFRLNAAHELRGACADVESLESARTIRAGRTATL
jgi:hypothetical protein